MNKTEVNDMLAGTVEDIKPQLAGLSNADLQRLHDAEEKGENRSTLLHAIDAARADEAAKPTASLSADYPAEFEQGRRAKASAISRDDAPHNAGTDQLAAWQEGFDSLNDNGAELRMQTGGGEPSALNQTATVAEANNS